MEKRKLHPRLWLLVIEAASCIYLRFFFKTLLQHSSSLVLELKIEEKLSSTASILTGIPLHSKLLFLLLPRLKYSPWCIIFSTSTASSLLFQEHLSWNRWGIISYQWLIFFPFPKYKMESSPSGAIVFHLSLQGGHETSHAKSMAFPNKRKSISEHTLFCEHSNLFLLESV